MTPTTDPVPPQTAHPQGTAAPEQPLPAVGDKYAHRPGLGDRTVTVTRVWDLGDGYGPAVAFEWRDNQPGQCGSACPLDVFHRAYEPVVAPPEPVDPWQTIARLAQWLNDANGCEHQEITLRLLKLSEEVGEVSQAWIGSMGQNPRKGFTHPVADVADELCDVIVTAMVALTSITDIPGEVFARKVAQIAALRLDDTAGGEQ
jgi:NTP pyrophosphatase (non-canonical NTP hydrolase)